MPYIFDKIYFVLKYHDDFVDLESIENIYEIIFIFFKIENIENRKSKQNNEDKNNYLIDDIDMEYNHYLKFLFYNNFDSYHNMKYIIKKLSNFDENKNIKIKNFEYKQSYIIQK